MSIFRFKKEKNEKLVEIYVNYGKINVYRMKRRTKECQRIKK